MRRHSSTPADPFGELRRPALREEARVLGGRFRFETDHRELLRIARLACANLPAHRLARRAPEFGLRLVTTAAEAPLEPVWSAREPPLVRPLSGDGLVCGATAASNFVALDPTCRAAIVVVSQHMLRFPYHLRYELLEFALYTLAARAQRLVSLHAACVGRAGRGILLVGASGAGKSTLALHSLLHGLDFLAEDSVLVRPEGLLATGLANFLHVRADACRFLPPRTQATVRRSPVIRRRSGVEKFELDLRRPGFRLAPAPQRLEALVFVSPRPRSRAGLLVPLDAAAAIATLESGQQFAVHQPGWSKFRSRIMRLPAFELRRGDHPREAVEALERLLRTPLRRAAAPRTART